MTYTAKVHIAPTKAEVPTYLNPTIANICAKAITARNAFTIALSGGSLPSFLSTMDETFQKLNIEPSYDKWHVILADERCVPSTHDDSNLGSLQTKLFSTIPVPTAQIHGIDETLLQQNSPDKEEGGAPYDVAGSTALIAERYEAIVRDVLTKSGGMLDVAVLGFGPDGHTCSLFPNHLLLQEKEKWVTSITDSPKPPPNRITLTLPMLNEHTRYVVFCGAGASKLPIIQAAWQNQLEDATATAFETPLADPAPYPCSMVRPMQADGDGSSSEHRLIWVVDRDAAVTSTTKSS